MKKIKLLLLTLVLTQVTINAQVTERNVLKEIRIETTTFTATQRVSGEDTLYYAFCSYQNKKYTSITDTEIIMFTKEGLEELIKAFEYMVQKEGSEEVEYYCSISKCYVVNSKFGIILYSKDRKYTLLKRKSVSSNIEELKQMYNLLK